MVKTKEEEEEKKPIHIINIINLIIWTRKNKTKKKYLYKILLNET